MFNKPLTTHEVVAKQADAVSTEYDHNESIKFEEARLPEFRDDEVIAEYQSLSDESNKIHSTPVNLSECTIAEKLCRIRLTTKSLHKYKTASHYKDSIEQSDLKWNMFYLIGEIAQAPGHIIVLGQSGKNYIMIHSSEFEVIPPQEC